MIEDGSHPNPRFITGIRLLALPQSPAGGLPATPVTCLRNVWIELENGSVRRIGPEGEPFPIHANRDECFDAGQRLVTPGFVESHTHPVFFQYRQNEFHQRCQGSTYLEIAAQGGGILSSVRGVRSVSLEELTRLVRSRFIRFLELGVTTVEAKSGYGLSVVDEIKSLQAIRNAATDLTEVSPTLLAAHTVPPEHKSAPDKYVEIVCKEIIPRASEENLADAVDIFVEESAFSIEQAYAVFKAGRDAGLGLRIHADQFTSSGGASLAAEFGAWSADHMDCTGEREIAKLAEAGVTVVLLPGAVFFLALNKWAPARKFIDAGCKIALSTDFNPGTSPTQSLPLMMTLGCNRLKMSPAESLWATTMGGASALRRDSTLGSLLPGYSADLSMWDAPDIEYLPYRFGDSIPKTVFKRGRLASLQGKICADYLMPDPIKK